MPDKRLITFTIQAILCVQCAMCTGALVYALFSDNTFSTALFAYFPHAAVASEAIL